MNDARRLPVLLDCTHTNTFVEPAPKAGEQVWCRCCEEYARVAPYDDYKVKCSNCRLRRRAGDARASAFAMARRHVTNYPSHSVLITLDDEVIGTVVSDTTPLEQIQTWVHQHQRSLKTVVETSAKTLDAVTPVVEHRS